MLFEAAGHLDPAFVATPGGLGPHFNAGEHRPEVGRLNFWSGRAITVQGMNRQRGAANPWMIIGWIVLALLVLPLALCTFGMVGGTASDSYNKYRDVAASAAKAPEPKK